MKKCKLKDLTVQIYDGKHGGCDAAEDTGLYFISVKDIDQYEIKYSDAMQISQEQFDEIYERTNLENGDTIYANTGDTIGKSVYIHDNELTDRTAFQKSVAVLKPNDSVDARFLYYLMQYETPRLRTAATGSGQKNLLLDTMRDFEVEVPDRPNQESISKVLGYIDDLRWSNLKVFDQLEGVLGIIYKYWFLQFDFPNDEGKPYKTSGGGMEWNPEVKKEIPIGWKVESINSNSISSIIKPGIEYFERRNYLETSNIDDRSIIDGEWVDYETREGRANMQPVYDSVWFAKMKNSRKHLTIPNDASWFVDKYVLSTGFCGISCNKNAVAYIHCFISDPYFEVMKDTLAHGATQKAVGNDDLDEIKIVIPPDDILDRFQKKVDNIIVSEMKMVEENQRLGVIFNNLMPLLMNGQVQCK